jgi:hypothetical protein
MTVKQKISGNAFKESESQNKRFNPYKSFRNFFAGTYLGEEIMIGFIPYVLFLGILAMIYISNIYKTEENEWKTIMLKREIEELKSEHVNSVTRNLDSGQRSSVSEKVKRSGLELPKEPPYQITNSRP